MIVLATALWYHHHVHGEDMCPMGCSQPMIEHRRGVKAGPFLGNTGLLWLAALTRELSTGSSELFYTCSAF